MTSSFMEFERRTLIVQFIAVKPLTFYATSDGTDLVQDILKSELVRPNADIFGQEGTLSIDEHGEFLSFEPTDTKNRTLHLPIEHLAYCGALRRMRRDQSDQRNPDQIYRRDFENVDLANRYAHYIIGPPIFVAAFHGFDNALCYIFLTQSADDACLLVMKLMRAFKQNEQQLEQQGRIDQGCSSPTPTDSNGVPSPVIITHGDPMHTSLQTRFADNSQVSSLPVTYPISPTVANLHVQDPFQHNRIQSAFPNSNVHVVNQVYPSSAPVLAPRIGTSPVILTSSSSVCHHSTNPTTIVVRAHNPLCLPSSCSCVQQKRILCQTTNCNVCCPPILPHTYVIDDPLSSNCCYSL